MAEIPIDSEKVRKWIAKLQEFSCPIPSIKTIDCEQNVAGQFDPLSNNLYICSNLKEFILLETTITHELIHAFDFCTKKFDLLNCKQIACSEVRAAVMSGDCDWRLELGRGNLPMFGGLEKCAKRRAILAMKMLPDCQSSANETVETIFEDCFNNYHPF
jgi:inner membrane protease ATP23